jgi:EpsD family peptidyl-prolyl cis-trans isomerase
MNTTAKRIPLALAAIGLGLMLAGCGNKDNKQVATQVAAKVGAEEISVHQINQVLQRTSTGGASPEAVQRMKREVLEKLIDQQLAVEQATEAKLHRSPDVVNQIEAARREILVRAYMQKVAANLPKATEEEVKKYHDEHPQLFAQRRIFNVQELVVPAAAPGVEGQLRRFAGGGKSIEEASAWLKGQNIAFDSGGATRAAEQLPLEVLDQLHGVQDGQSIVLAAPQAVTLLRVVSSQLTPIAQADALPRIKQFLSNRRTAEAVTANLKQLRESTAIVYMGEFGGATSANASPAAPAKSTAAAPAQVPAGPAPTVMEKGVAGLK